MWAQNTLLLFSNLQRIQTFPFRCSKKILMSPFMSSKIVHRLYVRRRCWRKLPVPQKKYSREKARYCFWQFSLFIFPFLADLLQYAPAVHSRMKFQQERNNVTRFFKNIWWKLFCPFSPRFAFVPSSFFKRHVVVSSFTNNFLRCVFCVTGRTLWKLSEAQEKREQSDNRYFEGELFEIPLILNGCSLHFRWCQF